MNGEKLYDLAFLNKISDGDENFIIDMIQTFRKNTPPMLQKIDRYLQEKNYEGLSREIHRFIPGVFFLGVNTLEKDLSLIEEYAKHKQNLDQLPGLIQQIKDIIDALMVSFTKDFNLE